MKKLLVLLLLVGCSESMSPDHCRIVGVDVDDNDTVTGRIIEENVTDQATVTKQCRRPFQRVPEGGCIVPIAPNEYIIWRIDDAKVRDHERCHALYEQRLHTF